MPLATLIHISEEELPLEACLGVDYGNLLEEFQYSRVLSLGGLLHEGGVHLVPGREQHVDFAVANGELRAQPPLHEDNVLIESAPT